jgi:plastocyanin
MKQTTLSAIFALISCASTLPYTQPDGELNNQVAAILSKPPFSMPASSTPEAPIATVAEIWGSQDVQTEVEKTWLDNNQYWGVTDVEADAPISNVHASAANNTQNATMEVPLDVDTTLPLNQTGPTTHTIMVNPNPGGYTFSFVPANVNITVGDSVQWVWVDQQNIHSVVELTGDPEQDTALCFLGMKAGGMDSGQRIAPFRMTKTYDSAYAGQLIH